MALFSIYTLHDKEAFIIHIQTTLWGELELAEEDVYRFPKGLPGFEEENAFVIVPWEDTPFSYLQSVKEPALAFLLVSPFLFVPDYSFELSEVDKEELQIQDQVSVYSIVTIQTEASKSTMNLLAPIVLNPEKRLGKQVVLHQSNYVTRHLIWAADETRNAKGGI